MLSQLFIRFPDIQFVALERGRRVKLSSNQKLHTTSVWTMAECDKNKSDGKIGIKMLLKKKKDVSRKLFNRSRGVR